MKPEVLLEHANFVRGLARSLVLDVHSAADIAQQTWVATLEHEPDTDRPLRSWLSRVTRNFVRSAHRKQRSRDKLERETTIQGDVPRPDEIAEREEVRRQMIDAVLALEEPYRSTILLRYYEDLLPRSIADRLAIPVGTVKTRLKRGLAILRKRLDAENDGDRGKWCTALAPVAGLKLAPTTAGTGTCESGTAVVNQTQILIPSTRVKAGILATVVVTLCVVGGLILSDQGNTKDSVGSDVTGHRDESSLWSEGYETTSSTMEVFSRLEKVPVLPEERESDFNSNGIVSQESKSGTILNGQVVDQFDNPVVDVPVVIKRVTIPEELLHIFANDRSIVMSEHDEDNDRKTVTDEKGRFEFPSVPPGTILVGVSQPSYLEDSHKVSASGVVVRVQNEERTKVIVKVHSGLYIRGRVVGPNSEPVTNILVSATPKDGFFGIATSESEMTGCFEIGPLHPGRYLIGTMGIGIAVGREVGTTAVGSEYVDTEPIEVDAGDDNVELALSNGGSIVGRVVGGPPEVDYDRLSFLSPGVSARSRCGGFGRETCPDTGGYFSFRGLKPGIYDLHAIWEEKWIGITLGVQVDAGKETKNVIVALKQSANLDICLNGKEGRWLIQIEYEDILFHNFRHQANNPVRVSVPPGHIRVVLNEYKISEEGKFITQIVAVKEFEIEVGGAEVVTFDLEK